MSAPRRAANQGYRSPAWPDPREPEFVNAVAEVETGLGAGALLRLLHTIEADLGRTRAAANAPRAIDLDLLDYRGAVEAGRDGPVLPHPRLHRRGFVLRPLLEIAPQLELPGIGALAAWLAGVADQPVEKLGA